MNPRNEVIPNHMQTTSMFIKSLFKTCFIRRFPSFIFVSRYACIFTFNADMVFLILVKELSTLSKLPYCHFCAWWVLNWLNPYKICYVLKFGRKNVAETSPFYQNLFIKLHEDLLTR